MMNEKTIQVMNGDFKTIKLIDRLYNGDSLNKNQLDSIWKLVGRKGRPTTRTVIYQCPVWGAKSQYPIDHTTEKRNETGYFYLGLFLYQDINGTRHILYMDVRTKETKEVLMYADGDLIRS